jgi:beta-lactamase regulating signal transducer with metallopeptidase domain
MTSLLERLPESSLWLMILVKMTALLAAAWMAHWLLLGRNPRWRVMLWRGVMAGLVVLPALELAMPAVPVKVPSPAPRAVNVQAAPAAAGDWFARRPAAIAPRGGVRPAAPHVEPSLLEQMQGHKGILLAIGWGLVAAALAARTLVLVARVRRLVKGASPAPQRITTLLARVAREMECSRHVGLRLTAALVSPFLTRVIRPVILLPERMTAPERSGELEGVLAHELAHVRGNDLVWLLLARGLSCVLWFHPLSWRLAGAHAHACEEVCDAVAAQYVGGAPAYSGMLARVALELMTDAPADGGVGMVRAASILERVRLVKRGIEASTPARRWIVVALTAGCLTLLALGSLKVVYAEQDKSPQAATTRAAAAVASRPGTTMEKKLMKSQATVKREDDKAWIAGTETLTWPEGSENTTLRSFAAALQIAGDKVTFEQIMGVSGAAFRMQIHKDGLCPSSPHAFCGFNCLEPALATLGYETIAYECKKDDVEGVAKTRAAIVESIDRGWPVLFCSEETGLVVGYKDKGAVLLVVPAYPKKPGLTEWTGWPWGFKVIQSKGKALPAREAAVESLQRAVQLAASERFDAYTAGFAAYDQWIAILEDGKVFAEDAAPKDRDGALLGNAFVYSCLIDARRCASKYLPMTQNQFWPEGATHIARAAGLYGQITAKLEAGWKTTRFPWQVAKDGPFTPQMRMAEAAVLKEVRDLERQAIGELEAALKVEGIDVAATAITTQSAKRIRTAVGATSMANPPNEADGGQPVAPAVPASQTGSATAAATQSTKAAAGRLVLPDVPRVGFDMNTCPLPGSVTACMKYLGDPVDYDYVMGVSGAAFRRLWQKDDGGNVDLMYLAPECYERLFEGIGYSCKGVFKADPETMTREIQLSLSRSRPVIAFGVIGPPEACVVAGYDSNGEVLIGWNYFQKLPGFGDSVEFEPSGYFRKGDWASNTRGLLVIGERRAERPSARQILLKSLRWAVDLEQTAVREGIPGHVAGLAAYGAWADGLEVDADYPQDDAKVLATREMIHMDQTVMLDERKHAAKYLRSMAKVAPEAAKELEAAAGHYDELAALSKKVWPWGQEMGPKVQQALADRQARREIARQVRAAGQKETLATEQLAKAVALLEKGEVEVGSMPQPSEQKTLSAVKTMNARPAAAPASGTPTRLDFSGVTLRGNPCTEDSFSKAVQVAAKLLGREVDLQTVRALSVNAFAPNIRPCEPCKSWWSVQAQDRAIDLVARRIGLRVESLPAIDHSADPPMPKDDEANREWLRTYYRKPIVPAIRKALDAGKVVIAGNEWDFKFHSCPWFGWGIITDAREDGTILGAALNGRRDNPMNYVDNAWVLSGGEPSLSAHQADVEMLRLAVDRIRGNTKANRADEGDATDTYVFGLEAMDAWIGAMETIPGFCAECQARGGRGWSDALDNGRLMHGGALFAASCLRDRMDSFPPAARPHLEAAAKQYDRIAQLLRPAVTTGDAGHYKTFIGDLAKQKVHADQVLRPIRDALASAADEMAAALAVEGVSVRPAKIRAVGPASQPVTSASPTKETSMDTVRLYGLRQSKMWMTRPGCLISCAQYLKTDASPAWIYGGTGYAFALNIHKDICPSGPTAWPSDECDARAANVGLVVKAFGTDKRRPDFQAERRKVWEQTKAALDAGQACMAWELGVPDWYVITGYDAEGNYLFDDFGRAEGRKPWSTLGDSEIGVVAVQTVAAGKPADDRTVVREAIRFAIEHSRGKGSGEDWHTGLAGYDTWITALTDEEALARNNAIGFGMGYNAACWNEARKQAVAFLEVAKLRNDRRKLDTLFDDAIERYGIVSSHMAEVATLYPFQKGPAAEAEGKAQVMDADRRAKAIAHLKAAKEAEVKGLAALDRIGEALEGMRMAEPI